MDELRRICATRTVFLRAEAIAAGYDDDALARSVRQKLIVRVRRGAYVFTEDWDVLDAARRHLVRAAAVRRQAKTAVVLSHTTAALAHGLAVWDLALDSVHITRPDERAGRREAGVAQHRGVMATNDIVTVDGVAVTSMARTAVDIGLMTDFEHGVCVFDAALASGRCTRDQLNEVNGRMTHVPGSVGLGLAIAFADARPESVGERRTRVMLLRGGLPQPVPQYEVRDRRGQVVARVDFAWPELGVFLEFDGKLKYDELLRPGESAADAVMREKRREREISQLTGWRCIRITWADLMNPAATCAMIRRALELAA